MSVLSRFFGRTDVLDELLMSILPDSKLVSAWHDQGLWALAEQRRAHISLEAVTDEYDRLTLEKHGPRMASPARN
jgi:hypothetical protein